MTSERLYEFWILSRTLSFSRAAERLFISQSVLSKHIAAMEKEMNAPLLYRDSHTVTLTEAGQMLARQAQEIISRCEQVERQLHLSHVPMGGSLRIACSLELSYASHIRLFVQQFMARYADTEVILDVIPGALPEETLAHYDLVFSPCSYLHPAPSVQKSFIMSHGTYVFLPPGHPMVSRSMIPLSQLANETLLVPHADELFGPYAKNAQLAERNAHGRLHLIPAANVSTALFMVSIGRGILIGPRYLRNLALPDTFTVNIMDQNCRFDEYLYRCHPGQSKAEVFEREFLEAFHISEAGGAGAAGVP
ncbi:MAG: LysR family transcriptional regulator [Aristaeellaceae bacterium]